MQNLLQWWRLKSLKSENIETRLRAVEKLAGKRGKGASTLLIDALDDPVADVRTRAADALARCGDPRAARQLVDLAVREREIDAADQITRSLTSLDQQQTIPALCEALYGDDERARQCAATALRRVAWKELPDGVKAEVAIIQDDWNTVASLGAAAVNPLHEILLTGTPQEKRNAVEAFGRIASNDAFRVLMGVFEDESVDEATRKVAGWGLRSSFWKRIGPAHVARIAIMHEEWSAAAKCGPPAVAPLVEVLNHGSLAGRRAAARALGEMRCPAAMDALAATLADANQDHRIHEAITEALESAAPARDTASLVQSLSDPYWSIRTAAAKALETREWRPTNGAERAALAIANKRWAEAAALGSEGIAPLIAALNFASVAVDAAKTLLGMGDEAVDRLLMAVNAPEASASTRELVATILAESRHPRALEPLTAMLKDPDFTIRLSAVWQLEQVGWKPTNDSERALRALAHEDWTGVRKCGPGAVEPLMRMIESGTMLEQTVPALQAVVEAGAARLPIAHLRKLSALSPGGDDVVVTPSAATAASPTDLSKIKRLAKTEMSRRGLLK